MGDIEKAVKRIINTIQKPEVIILLGVIIVLFVIVYSFLLTNFVAGVITAAWIVIILAFVCRILDFIDVNGFKWALFAATLLLVVAMIGGILQV